MIYGIPNDWTYSVKKALNYRIYSNPIAVSEMADIIHEELVQATGENTIREFNVDAVARTIIFTVDISNVPDIFVKINAIHANSIKKFYSFHRDEISRAITEVASKNYSDIFFTMFDNSHPMLISQLSIYCGHTLNDNLFRATFRLY